MESIVVDLWTQILFIVQKDGLQLQHERLMQIEQKDTTVLRMPD